jgi:hypothetical protein
MSLVSSLRIKNSMENSLKTRFSLAVGFLRTTSIGKGSNLHQPPYSDHYFLFQRNFSSLSTRLSCNFLKMERARVTSVKAHFHTTNQELDHDSDGSI